MKPAAIPEEVVQIVTASIIFFVCAHYIIEKMISVRSAKKRRSKLMSIVTILSILVSSMIVYAAPLIFTSIGGAYSEHAGVVNVGLEGIMVMGAFSGNYL